MSEVTVVLVAMAILAVALVLGLWVVMGAVRVMQAQGETALQHERWLTVRFADQALAAVDQAALLALHNARSIPDRQIRATLEEEGLDPERAARDAIRVMAIQRARRLEQKLEQLQGARPVMAGGPLHDDGDEVAED